MKRPYNILLWPALCVLLLMQGCLKEDLADCPPGITVRLYHDAVAGSAATDHATLFVFDENGLFVDVYENRAAAFGNDEYTMTLPLEKGKYAFAGFRGMYGCYSVVPAQFVKGVTTFSEAVFRLNCAADNTVRESPHCLFSGLLATAEVTGRSGHFDVYMERNTNIINLRTEGLEPSSDNYTLSISDNNSHYGFGNDFASCPTLDYIAGCEKDGQGQLSASLTVMRLAANRHPVFTVYNDSRQRNLYQADLMELIMRIPGINLTARHEFDILLLFDVNMDVTVQINGWTVLEEENEL